MLADEKPTTPDGLEALLSKRRIAAFESMQKRSEPSPAVFYHYCDSSTVEPILRNGCIWATEGSFLNDTTELHHARNQICALLETAPAFPALPGLAAMARSSLREHQMSPVGLSFIAAFSAEMDLLSQWRAYATDGTGVALGFDLSPLAVSENTATNITSPMVRPCVYDGEEALMGVAILPQLEAAAHYVERNGQGGGALATSLLLRSLATTTEILGLMLKNPGFREEREWRAVVWAIATPVPQEVKFRSTRFGPAPYVEIPIAPAQLKRLGLGPRIDRVAERSFRIMLERYGCNAEIYRSAVSYR